MLALGPHSRRLFHAGAVGVDGEGVLIAGPAGSGKSTLSLACALAGMSICGDDYVVVSDDDPLTAYALHSNGSVSATSARLLGLELRSEAFAEPGPAGPSQPAKAAVDLRRAAPGAMARSLRLRALVLPVVAGRDRPLLQRVSAPAGLRGLAPSTVFQQMHRDDGLLAAMGQLVSRLPSYKLELSEDMEANVTAIREAIDGD